VAALAAQAGTFYALPRTAALTQAVAAADGQLGRAEQDHAAKVAPGTSSGWGGRLRVTDLAAQPARQAVTAAPHRRRTVGPLWRRCCPKGDSR